MRSRRFAHTGMVLAVLRIRVRSGVLLIGKPGQLHDLMDHAHDEAGLSSAMRSIAGDRTALSQLRCGWPALVPGVNSTTLQHADLARDVARLVKAGQLDAALISERGMFVPKPIDLAAVRAVHLATLEGTLVVGTSSALTPIELAASDPGLVLDFFKPALPEKDLTPLRAAWPELASGGGQVPTSRIAMAQQIANDVKTRRLGVVWYPGAAGNRAAAARKDAPKAVKDWSMSEKLRAALLASFDYLGASLRTQLADFFTPQNIAQFVGVLAIFAVLQAIPIVGEIVDAGLLLTLWYYGGREALNGLLELAKGAIAANRSKSPADIDSAAKTLAKGIEHLGKGGLSLIFAWFATRAVVGKASTSEGTAGAPRSRPQSASEPPPRPGVKPLPAEVRAMPKAFQDEYRAAEAAGWKRPDGSTWYPPNNGGVGEPIRTTLNKNTVLDRFGKETGAYTSAAGDSFASRALPGAPGIANKYVVTARGAEKMLVEQSEIAPWFNQPGGGTQYRLVNADGSSMSVADAIQRGFLTRGP